MVWRWSLLISLILTFFLLCPLTWSQNAGSSPAEETEAAAAETPHDYVPQDIQGAAAQSRPPDLLVRELEEIWHAIRAALEQGDYKEANLLLAQLDARKSEFGYLSLDDYSMELLHLAEQKLASGDRDGAGFLARKALQLSPQAGAVLMRSVRVSQLSGSGSPSDLLRRAIRASVADKLFLLKLLKGLIYPALWACTLGLYVALALSFYRNFAGLLQGMARFMPAGLRGFVTPLAVLGLLLVPCLWGPLWCLWLWSVVACLSVARLKWLGFCAVVIIVLWASLIPIRENLDLRLNESGVRALLRASSGNYNFVDRERLQKLVSEYPGDPVAQFVYGQVLRREGDYVQAERALQKANALWHGREPLAKAELGVAAFLAGELEKADELFSAAEKAGVGGAAFLFNYSKVKLDLLDTAASRELLGQANKRDPELVAVLRGREEALGLRSRQSIAEIPLPISGLIPSLLAALPDGRRVQQEAAFMMMPGVNPVQMAVLAFALLAVFFLAARERHRARGPLYYCGYKPLKLITWIAGLIPGGAWAMAGKPVHCAVVCSIVALLGMPLAKWPADSRGFLEYTAGLTPYYVSAWLLMFLGVLYVGCFVRDQGSVGD